MVSAGEIRGRDLRHRFSSGARALDGIDVELGPGDLLCVVGPNGSGKSTLLRVLAGLLVPDEGEVVLDGRAVRSLSSAERASRMAVVPQSLAGLPDVRVRDFVMGGRYAHLGFFGRHAPEDAEAVDRALADTDLDEMADRLLAELSGGQRQRALLARALAQGSGLWLVDEPTTSLDVEHQVRAFELIAEICKTGRSALVVTHDLNLASQFATEIALFDRGRVAARGTPGEVLRREVLEPVYGPHLSYGTLETPGGPRPFVVPFPDGAARARLDGGPGGASTGPGGGG